MITLYSTHCPRCSVLEKKLQQKGIEFNMIDDTDAVLAFADQQGLKTAPFLDIGEEILTFEKAVAWLREQGTGGEK